MSTVEYVVIDTKSNVVIMRSDSYDKLNDYINSLNSKFHTKRLKIMKSITTYEEV